MSVGETLILEAKTNFRIGDSSVGSNETRVGYSINELD
jgi:hypothetical protein